MNGEISITIKVSTGQTHVAKLDPNLEVSAAKAKLADVTGVPAENQRLIYAGHVLKDNQTIASYNIKDGHTVHLVKGAPKAGAAAPAPSSPAAAAAPGAAAQTPFSPFGGLGAGAGAGGFGAMQAQMLQNPEMMQAMMENPMVQGLLNDPETMRQMMMMNPQTRAMMDANPEVAQILNNPEMMRQAMEAMRNPAILQEMQRTNDRAMANLDANPHGFNALRRMYQDVQEPLENAAAQAPAAENPFASLFAQQQGGAAPAAAAAPAGGPLPNPWGGGGAAAGAGAGVGAGAAGAAGGAGGLADMFQNPMVQQMTQQMLQNPQMMENIMRGAGPLMGGGAGAGLGGLGGIGIAGIPAPDLPIMLDPATLARYQQVQGNAAVVQAAAQLRLAIAGFRNAIDAAAPAAPNAAAAPPVGAANAGANPFASLFAAAARPPPPAGGVGGGGGAAPPVNLAARYQAELKQLNDMGFHDADANLRALVATGGNVNAALELLLR